ncbi:MAG: hypothetical protein ACTHOU_20235 [Aureliella sp.]
MRTRLYVKSELKMPARTCCAVLELQNGQARAVAGDKLTSPSASSWQTNPAVRTASCLAFHFITLHTFQ